ncbi:MAG: NERD domain-containing protein [Anaerolineales bacterium]|nr:NERD domain-containing protein [Anaerolineales bacterium]
MKVHECGGKTLESRQASAGRKSSAKDFLIQNLRKALDNRFHMICDVCLDEGKGALPLILLGPTGVWVILTDDAKGVFRISETTWEELQSRRGGYKTVYPSPMTVVLEKTQELLDYLLSRGIKVPTIEPAVFFSDPGAHIESTKPAARIIPVDALQRFLITVWRSPVVFDEDEVQIIVNELAPEGDETETGALEEIDDIYSMREPPAPKKPAEPSKLSLMAREEPALIRRIAQRFPFSRRQWIMLGVLLVVNIVILVGIVVVVLIIT